MIFLICFHTDLQIGAGGTQRLPRLVGIHLAYDMISKGKLIDGKEALTIGILDHLIDNKITNHDQMINAAIDYSLSDIVQRTPVSQRILSKKSVFGDKSHHLFQLLEEKIKKESKGYDINSHILKALKAAAESSSFEEGLQIEKDIFMNLIKSKPSRALQYFFFSERKCSKIPDIDISSKNISLKDIRSVGIVGGGTMGAGIAMTMANAGIPAHIIEETQVKADDSVRRIKTSYMNSSAFRHERKVVADVNNRLSCISAGVDISTLSNVDLVIEAAVEDMSLKKSIFWSLDNVCKPGAILASNTSTLSIAELARSTSRPADVIGLRKCDISSYVHPSHSFI